MRLERRSTQIISFFLDEILPPILRDQCWFMWPLQWLLFRQYTKEFMDFKIKAPGISSDEVRRIYENTSQVHLQRETDLTPACLAAVETSIKGNSVLEVGCGRGYLLNKLANNFKVTGVDFVLDPKIRKLKNKIQLICADVEMLPFVTDGFDTVVCTHTLEHVKNLHSVMGQLRRIARKRLVVVVPLQRPYKYTFDLHLHFFPYPHSFLNQVGMGSGKVLTKKIGRDLLYLEDM